MYTVPTDIKSNYNPLRNELKIFVLNWQCKLCIFVIALQQALSEELCKAKLFGVKKDCEGHLEFKKKLNDSWENFALQRQMSHNVTQISFYFLTQCHRPVAFL